ncbi:MAG: hypothetical protein ACRC30_11570 [Clostridium sp.]
MIEFLSNGKIIIEFIIASISVISCIGAFVNRNKANETLNEIKKIKKEIMEKEAMSNIPLVKVEVGKIQEIIRAYSSKSSNLTAGRDTDEDIKCLKNSLTTIKENKILFGNKNNKIDIFYSDINSVIDLLVDDIIENNQFKREMRNKEVVIDEFLACLKSLERNKKFK